jgi:hypothetical protein
VVIDEDENLKSSNLWMNVHCSRMKNWKKNPKKKPSSKMKPSSQASQILKFKRKL